MAADAVPASVLRRAAAPSQITPQAVKEYRRKLHEENALIRAASESGKPFRNERGQALRPLGNRSINGTLQTLAAILDEAEDAGWVVKNVARGRRTREPVERKKGDVLELDEFLSLLEAADHLDRERHSQATLQKAELVRELRDVAKMSWLRIAECVGVAPTTAMYLHECVPNPDAFTCGPRRAVIATLALAGLRVNELCQLDRRHVNLATATIHVADSKTPAGVRAVDIRPRLLDDLTAYRAARRTAEMEAPEFPTSTGSRRTKDNVRARVILTVLKHANELRASRDQPPILARVAPHTFRRTYITFMLAAGFDLPYVQSQVGHVDPAVTLAVYAQVIRRQDRDRLREEMRELLGEQPANTLQPHRSNGSSSAENGREKAGKGSKRLS